MSTWRGVGLAAVAAIVTGLPPATAAAAGGGDSVRRGYVVQLDEPPAAAYEGGVTGLPATRPAAGRRLDVDATAVRRYMDRLRARQSGLLAVHAPAAPVLHRYTTVLNGFTALLTDAEARALVRAPGVRHIAADALRPLDTVSTARFLGLEGVGGLWERLGGVGASGEDVIVGVVDSGIWPESPSFSDRERQGRPVPSHQNGVQVYGPPPARWKGSCQAGPGFEPARHCNHKLIGAQVFDTSFRALVDTGVLEAHPSDYRSPRDNSGHGTHTASTAAGNASAPAMLNGLDRGPMSGMAPRARVAAYKACWAYGPAAGSPTNGCFVGDSVAAIEKAVADGVDVINFSISGSRDDLNDPVEQAFLHAASAGVFVAASAGNNGPEASTVAHNSPWVTTVAASTHDRRLQATLTLSDGRVIVGASQNRQPATAPLVLATDAMRPGVSPQEAYFCYPNRLDPARIAGRIVICDPGGGSFRDGLRGRALARDGAAGMIIVAQSTSYPMRDDPQYLPALQIPATARDAVRAHARVPGNLATIGVAQQAADVVAPVMAPFSSRGPNLASPHLLKPDLSAPGVDVIAAYPDPPADPAARDLIAAGTLVARSGATSLRGTSMSTPHVAGLAALLRQAQPGWSPAAIKSALITTAGPVWRGDGTPDADRLAFGAGHVRPVLASAPGLVFDVGSADYRRFLCGAGLAPAADCQATGAIPPRHLNLPSMAGEVPGRIDFVRTVRHVGALPATYESTIDVPGYAASVEPSRLTLQPGQTGSFRVDLRRIDAPMDAWVGGRLAWSDGTVTVTSPVAVQARALVAPQTLSSTLVQSARTFTLAAGYDGALVTVAGGLRPARVIESAVPTALNSSGESACQAGEAGTRRHRLTVAEGALVLRLAMVDEETSGWAAGGIDDLDLFLFGPDGALVAYSGAETATESIEVRRPPAGAYTLCVHGYRTVQAEARYRLDSWVITPSDRGGGLRVVAPSQARAGATASAVASWSVLPGRRYLAAISFEDPAAARPLWLTTLHVDARGTLPAPGPFVASTDKRTRTLRR